VGDEARDRDITANLNDRVGVRTRGRVLDARLQAGIVVGKDLQLLLGRGRPMPTLPAK
jgi:hypothetical protein